MRDLVFMLIMAVTMPMALFEPYIGLMLWVLLSDMNPYRRLYGFASTFHWVFIVAILTLIGMVIKRQSVQRVHWNGLAVTLLLFTLSACISTGVAIFPAFAQAQLILFLKVMVIVVVMVMLLNTPGRIYWMIWIFIVSIGFWAVKGGVFTLAHGGNYHVSGPPNTFIGDNNQLALAMCMVLPLMRYMQIHATNKWVKYGMWISMGLTAISIFGTYSRGGLITLGVVLILILLKNKKRFGPFILGVILVAFAANFLPAKWVDRMHGLQSGTAVEGSSFQGRVQSWQFATNVALNRPFTGGGFGVWASLQAWNSYGPPDYTHALAIHSIWFKVLAEQGVTGIFLYVIAMALAWRTLSRIRKRTKPHVESHWLYDLAGYLQVSLFAFMVAGSALPMAYFNLTFQLFGFFVALDKLVVDRQGVVKFSTSLTNDTLIYSPGYPPRL